MSPILFFPPWFNKSSSFEQFIFGISLIILHAVGAAIPSKTKPAKNQAVFLLSASSAPVRVTPLTLFKKDIKPVTMAFLKRFYSGNMCACSGLFSDVHRYTFGTLVDICGSEAVNIALSRPCLSQCRNVMNF